MNISNKETSQAVAVCMSFFKDKNNPNSRRFSSLVVMQRLMKLIAFIALLIPISLYSGIIFDILKSFSPEMIIYKKPLLIILTISMLFVLVCANRVKKQKEKSCNNSLQNLERFNLRIKVYVAISFKLIVLSSLFYIAGQSSYLPVLLSIALFSFCLFFFVIHRQIDCFTMFDDDTSKYNKYIIK
jgi:hypothetical protein